MLPASAWASDATISASYGEIPPRFFCTFSANLISPVTVRNRLTIVRRILSAVGFGGELVGVREQEALDGLGHLLAVRRLNQNSGMPNASGFFAAAWKFLTGILVCSDSFLNV